MFQGILLGFLAYALFATHDASVKGIGAALPVFEIGFVTGLFAAVVFAVAKPQGEHWRNVFRMNRPSLVLVRAAAGIGAGLLGILAFTRIPLAEAYALIFLAPSFATAMSIVLLGESVGWRRWAAVAIGLVGILFVVRPGFREIGIGHAAAVGTALSVATTVIVLRVLGEKEQRITIVGVLIAAYLVVSGTLTLTVDARLPDLRQLGLLALAGTGAALGQLALMGATRLAPANRVAPTQYSQLAWAVILGAVVFGEPPDGPTIVGLVLIGVSGLFILWRERRMGGE